MDGTRRQDASFHPGARQPDTRTRINRGSFGAGFRIAGASRDQLSSFMMSVAPSTTITCTNLSVVNIRLKVAIVDAEF